MCRSSYADIKNRMTFSETAYVRTGDTIDTNILEIL